MVVDIPHYFVVYGLLLLMSWRRKSHTVSFQQLDATFGGHLNNFKLFQYSKLNDSADIFGVFKLVRCRLQITDLTSYWCLIFADCVLPVLQLSYIPCVLSYKNRSIIHNKLIH